MIAKNRSGWILHEYVDIEEDAINDFPNVTGAYAIIKVRDNYLIGFNDWRNQWEFPAGGIEEGESARQAASRELYEETHQKCADLKFKGLCKITDPRGRHKYQAVFVGEIAELVPFVHREEDEMSKIYLWDLKEDIGYVDECDIAIAKRFADEF